MDQNESNNSAQIYGAGQAKHYAMSIIVPVFAVACFAIWQLVSMYRFSNVYPAVEKRHNITEANIASMSEVCDAANFDVKAIEDCLKTLTKEDSAASKSKYHPLKVPPVDEIDPQSYPRFYVLLEEQGITHIPAAIDKNEPIFFNFKVPRTYFLKNEIGVDPYALIFTQAPHGRLCIEDHCQFNLDRGDYLSLSFPLFENDRLPEKKEINITIIYTERATRKFGINLEQGFFVAKLADTIALRSFHKALIQGQGTITSIILLMLLFVSLVMAVTWRQYLDYTAFTLIVFFEAITRNLRQTSTLKLLMDESWVLSVNDCLNAASLCAAVAYAASTHRISGKRFLKILGWCAAAVAIFTAAMHTYRVAHDLFHTPRTIRTILISLKVILPPIVAIAVWRFSASYNEVSDKDRKRRTFEQSLIAACLLLYTTPEALWIFNYNIGLWTYDLTALTPLAIFPLFAVMIYTTHGVLSSRVNEYHKEVSRLSGLAAIGSLAQMIAHDVRTPFSTLKIGLQLISRNPTTQADPKIHALVRRISKEVDHSLLSVNAMLDDIMEVNRPNQLDLSESSLVTAISSCISPLSHRIREKNIFVAIDFKHTNKAYIDPVKVLRVFSNIIGNAVDMTPQEGTIVISTHTVFGSHHSEPGIIVSIFNSGSFIPLEDRGKLFQPFYTRRKKGGIGLGLSIVKKIMDAHPNSSITIESTEHEGTTFVLKFKDTGIVDSEIASFEGFESLSQEPERSSSETVDGTDVAKTITQNIGTLRILMIEDEDIYSDGVNSTFQSISSIQDCIEFTAVKNWQSVDQSDLHSFHLIITDIDLKDSSKDGFEIISEVRKSMTDAFICVHTNRSFPEDTARVFNAGADFMIPKPLAAAHALKILIMTMRKGKNKQPANVYPMAG